MLFTSLAVVTAATSKWLIAGKIMVAVGGCCITVDRAIKDIKRERRYNR